jgi:ABC-type Fe3+ transport system substrate-binding protein
LLPFYPGLNLESDHPFAILQGDWVTPDEREAARTFRDFLLSKPIQQLALASGFRPTSPDVQITDIVPNNAFLSQPPVIQSMLKANIEPLGQPPGGDVIDTLIKQWVNSYGTKPTTTG